MSTTRARRDQLGSTIAVVRSSPRNKLAMGSRFDFYCPKFGTTKIPIQPFLEKSESGTSKEDFEEEKNHSFG